MPKRRLIAREITQEVDRRIRDDARIGSPAIVAAQADLEDIGAHIERRLSRLDESGLLRKPIFRPDCLRPNNIVVASNRARRIPESRNGDQHTPYSEQALICYSDCHRTSLPREEWEATRLRYCRENA